MRKQAWSKSVWLIFMGFGGLGASRLLGLRLILSISADKSGTGGHATEGADSSGGAKKAKEEFPEAPDTIGMQDERGGRGG
jgi:hypothetical protein